MRSLQIPNSNSLLRLRGLGLSLDQKVHQLIDLLVKHRIEAVIKIEVGLQYYKGDEEVFVSAFDWQTSPDIIDDITAFFLEHKFQLLLSEKMWLEGDDLTDENIALIKLSL